MHGKHNQNLFGKNNLRKYSSELTKHLNNSGETGTDFNSFFAQPHD